MWKVALYTVAQMPLMPGRFDGPLLFTQIIFLYKININILKRAIDECDCMVSRFMGPNTDEPLQQHGGGLFAMFDA